MKILLFGEYSNVHWTLAEALRKSDNQVLVVSDGDHWKNYKRDINISYDSKFKFLLFLFKLLIDKRFRNNDIVQIINYRFLFKNKLGSLNKFAFDFLKKHNKKIVLCAFGDDYFYVKACLDKKLAYSPISEVDKNTSYIKEIFQVHYSKVARNLNEYIAENSDGIVSCMYDYYISYKEKFDDKLVNIPLPIDTEKIKYNDNIYNGKLNIFLGVQTSRIEWKGTDIIMKSLTAIKEKYKNSVDISIVENVPYHEYINMFTRSNLFFDQTYSYGQGMNGLMAMAAGKILFGGAEQKHYELVGETSNFPIMNITSDVIDIENKIEYFINKPHEVFEQGKKSYQYILDHHDSMKVAKKYSEYYEKLMKQV
ncbi:glycosyltransferase [Chryseobacterium daecheongense]|uniref:Glycosyltransferase family 1 protein n=1 Tax=Chryseobacterium daecheongense TaxID=192389 RepID=A0A3N0W6A0_9FLAO|nr:glycosyltransferase [Chryseobacterium daecheongense]ROI00525.1 glycosyltransferase family 1 protein [Chryseobacterium daecheongense]TDX94499.1 glycosyltransferase involved in cell wall biosynthesis [Chryseobacterium daecheongense]